MTTQHLENTAKVLTRMGFVFNGVLPFNNYRYMVLKGLNTPNLFYIYKTAWFHNYGKKFNKSGMGESVNKEHIEIAERWNCSHILRTNGEEVLFAKLKDFVKGDEWTNKEGKKVVSNSMHLFKRYETIKELYEQTELIT